MRFRICFLLLSFSCFTNSVVWSQENIPVNLFRNLTKSDSAALGNGETVFRQPSSWKDLSLPLSSPFYKEIEDVIKKGNQNYIGEILLVMPEIEGDTVISEISSRLVDFEHYAGMPYWSERKKRYYDLFDWIKVNKGTREISKGFVETTQFMKPFGEYSASYNWAFGKDLLIFSGVNTTPITYKGVWAVNAGNMVWLFRAYSKDNYWIFYGLGAVKAFDLYGALRDRLSVSFMGRIEAFFRYAYGE